MSESLPLSLDSFCLCRLFDPCAPIPSNACLIGLKWRQSDRSETYLIPKEHSLRLPQTGPSWWPVITDALLCNRSLISTREALQGHLNIPNITLPPSPPFHPSSLWFLLSNFFSSFLFGSLVAPLSCIQMRMFGGEQMVCVRRDVLFPQHLRGPSASRGTVRLSEPHSSSRYGADGARATIVTHTAPDATKHLTDAFFCMLNVSGSCIVYKQSNARFWFLRETWSVYCVCLLRVFVSLLELMLRSCVSLCFCMFFLFISSRFIWQMGTTCPFPLFLCCSAREFISMPFPSRPHSHSDTLTHSH